MKEWRTARSFSTACISWKGPAPAPLRRSSLKYRNYQLFCSHTEFFEPCARWLWRAHTRCRASAPLSASDPVVLRIKHVESLGRERIGVCWRLHLDSVLPLEVQLLQLRF